MITDPLSIGQGRVRRKQAMVSSERGEAYRSTGTYDEKVVSKRIE